MTFRRWPYSANLPAYPAPPQHVPPEGAPLPQWQPYSVPSPQQLPGYEGWKPWSPTENELSRWGASTSILIRDDDSLLNVFKPTREGARMEPRLPVPQTIRILLVVNQFLSAVQLTELQVQLTIGLGSTLLQRTLLVPLPPQTPVTVELLQPAQTAYVILTARRVVAALETSEVEVQSYIGLESPLRVESQGRLIR